MFWHTHHSRNGAAPPISSSEEKPKGKSRGSSGSQLSLNHIGSCNPRSSLKRDIQSLPCVPSFRLYLSNSHYLQLQRESLVLPLLALSGPNGYHSQDRGRIRTKVLWTVTPQHVKDKNEVTNRFQYLSILGPRTCPPKQLLPLSLEDGPCLTDQRGINLEAGTVRTNQKHGRHRSVKLRLPRAIKKLAIRAVIESDLHNYPKLTVLIQMPTTATIP